MKPLADRIIIKQAEAEEKTRSGIILPDEARQKPLEGVVEAVGPKVADVKVGDTVLYGKYAHQEFDVNGDKLIVINEPDVIAIVTK